MRVRAARTAVVAISVLAIGLPLAGCGDDESASGGERPELVVFAASSLGPAFEQYEPTFEEEHGVDLQFSFAGSDELAAQIRQGVTPDVYAAANTELPDDLAADDLLEKPITFVTNKLVVGVPAGSPIDEISDLEQPGTKLAIGDEDVPVGSYTREVLSALGPEASDAILANVASSEPDVGGIVGKLTQGAVDAGFVYQSDVEAAAGELEAIELPKEVSPDVAYGIGISPEAGEPELARQFVDSVVDGEGQEVLLGLGFGPIDR